MDTFSPFIVKLYWGGAITYKFYTDITVDYNTESTTFIMTHRMSYSDFLDRVCLVTQIDKCSYNVRLTMYYTFEGCSEATYITGNEGMEMMFYLASNVNHYMAVIHIQYTPLVPLAETSAMDLLRRFTVSCGEETFHTPTQQQMQSINLELGSSMYNSLTESSNRQPVPEHHYTDYNYNEEYVANLDANDNDEDDAVDYDEGQHERVANDESSDDNNDENENDYSIVPSDDSQGIDTVIRST